MPSDASPTLPDLAGKIALVTGGARGLGVEIARGLADAGAHVIVAARDPHKAEEVAASLREKGGNASSLRLDVVSAADRTSAFETISRDHGRLDILINNAGILLDNEDAGKAATYPPSETPETILRQTFEVNFFSLIFLTQTLLPLLRRSAAGRIVNLSSIRGSFAFISDPHSPVYGDGRALAYDSSKVAINAFSVLLGEELRGSSIKVNSVHPGWLRTAMGGETANMAVEDGAFTPIHYAGLGEDGPTGGFFFMNDRLPW